MLKSSCKQVGGLALLLGGAVRGGRTVGDWPGLSRGALYEGRDLVPTVDYVSVFKALLTEQLGVAPDFAEERVFPESRSTRALAGLFHRV